MVVMGKHDRFIVFKMMVMLVGAVVIGTLTVIYGFLYTGTKAM